ncbi:hypothetical protein GLOTRDRAFT_126152 [Gloeophyllum trabeum ATCC 11539]|uniref:DUF6534 domain-containing protein n=1 Tax=Gloeophyllum trabeum (strain ATCC 11539 / FP-39264 / Madison 617) TaxID=670483 RepID=S7QKE5_GLOTA|nr:uncharacterized protein GLOTRDRAFT_126152 [Gloeophyllum trabeum ATCC 11539]EPQ59857.1 hypothetical protein GLOTRDRAFT_126152 [Gloeophyllum trabeum ATCC 11539]
MGAFDTTIGILLLGIFFNTYLYGLVSWQFLTYANTKFNDPWRVKAVVGSLFVLDTVHTIVGVYNAWRLCVANFGNPAVILTVGWEIPFTAIATSFAAIITQFFLADRVFRLTKSWVLTGTICTLSLVGFVSGVVAGIRSGIIQDVAGFGVLAPLVICWLGFQTAADLSITFVLSWALYRSRGGIQRTNRILNRLIRGAVQTGLFASIFALGDLFGFLLHRQTNLYAMFAYPIGRIYTNTLLDTLNGRTSLASMNGSGVEFDTESNGLRFRGTTRSALDTNANIRLQQVHVMRDVVTITDAEDTSKHSDDKMHRPDDPAGVFTHSTKAV